MTVHRKEHKECIKTFNCEKNMSAADNNYSHTFTPIQLTGIRICEEVTQKRRSLARAKSNHGTNIGIFEIQKYN